VTRFLGPALLGALVVLTLWQLEGAGAAGCSAVLVVVAP
jgi:hypothetical protein